MTLEALHTRLRRALAKGTSLDEVIPGEVAQAARWIERQRSYQYMRRFGTSAFSLSSEFPYMLNAPVGLKALKLVRIVLGDGTFHRVERSRSYDELTFESGLPTRYELDGVARIVFNATPTEAWTVQLFWDEFTSWPTEPTATNWLLEYGNDALFYQTQLQLSADLRDPRQRTNLQALRDEALRTMLIADEELQESDRQPSMRYNPTGGFNAPTLRLGS